ncbi:hypothetical protein QBC35DRAFT_528542 [Podospora australis]|uniref:RING-CH-type domain-containing protein n=1 Tax=Podospora australis TaxID=1536484 RepID=A0AAN7ANL0_9PEZI|nr:hypothetical protein QBC35DRAFT_528542 [Podospora australis]
MATPTSSAAGGTSTPISSIMPAPYATNDQHVCFICLQNEVDTPDANWVNPCPCSLEAHEECMLQWIAETEVSSNRPKSGLQCPACKAPITVEEPYDRVVAFRNALLRRYSRISPHALIMIVGTSSMVGAAGYGWAMMGAFAGDDAVYRWVFKFGHKHPVLPRVMALAALGPGLVLVRALQPIASLITFPVGLLSVSWLLATEGLPQWPPSPSWAIAILPCVQYTYNRFYMNYFGVFERRLNRALRGRPMDEPEAQRQNNHPNGNANANAGGNNNANANNNEEDEGMWNSVVNLGRAVMGLFDDEVPEGEDAEGGGRIEEVVIELDLNLGGGNGGNDDDDNNNIPDHNAEEGEDLVEDIQQILAENEAAVAGANPPAAPRPPFAAPAPPPPAAAQQPQQNQDRNHRRNADDAQPSGLSMITNGIVTSLLLPVIASGVGEAIRLTAPKSWVTRPSLSRWGGGSSGPKGLLQERWGRSLVGGALFLVLRDAFALYAKYRRVQVKLNRKVKNVDKKNRGTTTTTAYS